MLRIYADIHDAFLGIIVYSAAIAVSLYVVYSLYFRWCEIADRYYDTRMFYRAKLGQVGMIVFAIVLLCLVVAGIWVASTVWVVYLALFVVFWIMVIVTLIVHRRHRPPMRDVPIVLSLAERKHKMVQVVTSHHQLDNMMVLLIVIASVLVVKSIFLLLCFILIPLFFITPFYYVFCVIPDLAFVMLMANSESLPLFETSRHVPEMRKEIMERENGAPMQVQDQHAVPVMTAEQYMQQNVPDTSAPLVPAQHQALVPTHPTSLEPMDVVQPTHQVHQTIDEPYAGSIVRVNPPSATRY